jgi:hypothetical protein
MRDRCVVVQNSSVAAYTWTERKPQHQDVASGGEFDGFAGQRFQITFEQASTDHHGTISRTRLAARIAFDKWAVANG